MAARVIFMGRTTADPVVSTSQNGVPYIILDLAVSQYGQNGKDEVVYYQCYFNQTFIERINKAKVRKGSCLIVVGVLELHPFIYQQGSRAGQAGINANVRVVDWCFPQLKIPHHNLACFCSIDTAGGLDNKKRRYEPRRGGVSPFLVGVSKGGSGPHLAHDFACKV